MIISRIVRLCEKETDTLYNWQFTNVKKTQRLLREFTCNVISEWLNKKKTKKKTEKYTENDVRSSATEKIKRMYHVFTCTMRNTWA